MILIDFNNEPTKIVTLKEVESIMNSVGMDWYGFKYYTINDREMFESKTNASVHPTNDGKAILHDRNFNWESE